MIQSKTRWVYEEANEQQQQLAQQLAEQLSLPSLVAKLLVSRGIVDVASARSFLSDTEEQLHDPFLLEGMQAAVDRIQEAVRCGEKVRIYGDYDADGVSSTAVLHRVFKQLGIDYDYYIPHRVTEGYGLHNAALDDAAASGIGLVITVDTGISAVEQIEYARQLGIDVIVTDHHEPPHIIPDACAVVNPKQENCRYPFKGLAGAGVAFKLGHALLGRPPLECAEIAALGTVADLMPLTGENRIIVRLGLKQMQQTTNPGLRALSEVADIELEDVRSTDIAFGIAPRINAAGRLAHAELAVELLITGDPEEAIAYSLQLDALNKQRQKIVEDLVDEAEQMWQLKCEACRLAGEELPAVIVLAGQGWNAGVIGIVASKLIERHYLPTIIISIDAETGLGKGSARSIDGFDLHAALTECAELMVHYGGHQAAAGMTIRSEHIPDLAAALSALARSWLSKEDWVRKTTIDVACTPGEAGLETAAHLSRLEPFGAGNPSPRLLLRQVELEEARTMGKGSKHMRLSVRHTSGRLEAVNFGGGALACRLSQGAIVDLVGELSVNEWNGNRKPQLKVADLRVEAVQLFDLRGNGEEAGELLRERIARRLEAGTEASSIVVAADGKLANAEVAAAQAETERAAQVVLADYDDEQQLGDLACRELILLQFPPSAARLGRLLRACRGLESVVALYSADRRRRAGFPQREHFGKVFQHIRKLAPAGIASDALRTKLSETIGWMPDVVGMMLDVFAELEFISIQDGQVVVHPAPRKRELQESKRYSEALQQAQEDAILLASGRELTNWINRTINEQ
ncbi:single-stranded-DNA-specific exonuclease RecJ [Paenibacillaceae bacterium]|nr:single-stranded-DNA-specific exonuclease RecJ [Paenibacillaceae bacterium]